MSALFENGPFEAYIGELLPPKRPRSSPRRMRSYIPCHIHIRKIRKIANRLPALTKLLPYMEGHSEATRKANRFGSS